MKMIVLLKRVPDLVEDLEVDDGGTALATEFLKLTLNESDDHALEEALLLKDETGGHVTVVALDGDEIEKTLYTALAKGADRALRVTGAGGALGTRQLAGVLAGVISGAGPYDLVLTGVQAPDDVDGQLAPMLAESLDLPCVEVVTGVSAVEGTVTLLKEYSGGVVAELEMDTPGVLGIQAARNAPRYAPVSKVRQVQEASTLEDVEYRGDVPAPGCSVTAMAPPEVAEGAEMLESVDQLLAVLESKGVL